MKGLIPWVIGAAAIGIVIGLVVTSDSKPEPPARIAPGLTYQRLSYGLMWRIHDSTAGVVCYGFGASAISCVPDRQP